MSNLNALNILQSASFDTKKELIDFNLKAKLDVLSNLLVEILNESFRLNTNMIFANIEYYTDENNKYCYAIDSYDWYDMHFYCDIVKCKVLNKDIDLTKYDGLLMDYNFILYDAYINSIKYTMDDLLDLIKKFGIDGLTERQNYLLEKLSKNF